MSNPNIPTPHITAKEGDFARTVLMPGDPLRSKFIAETYLENPVLVNNTRGVQGYTGTYQGKRVSVMASGMGIPSMGIYSYELFNFYGVENIIRIGTAGGMADAVKVRDVVMGLSAYTNSNFGRQFGFDGNVAPCCSFKLLEQAVAAARLGGDVAFVSCLGDDAGAAALRQQFAADGINTEALFTAKDTPTGTALIFVSQDGENCIAVAPGANHSLTCEAIDAVADRIAGAEYLLVQLEIPMETVACAIEKAYAAGTRVVLNPAPAMPLADELLRKVYLITPNRTESETLTGIPVHTVQDASKAAGALLAKGVGNVIVTLGSEGALIRTPAEELLIPARTVTPVDTTAAGDVFNGALLVALSEGRSLADAVRFAAHSASVSVTRMGAQASIPWRGELETLA